MIFTRTIPAEQLRSLDVHEGDTLRILATLNSAFLVQISREEDPPPAEGKVSEWLRTSTGIVKLAPGETEDDVRMEYYKAKYGLTDDELK